jgi:hypothetical protein
MTFSKQILSTDKEKIKLSWWDYWIGHCWMTGWQSIRSTFRIWSDLMTSNYENYALLKTDDPFTECYNWFWCTLNEDETYPKEFLEYLLKLSDDVKTGKEKLIPLDENFFDTIDDLVGDLDDE